MTNRTVRAVVIAVAMIACVGGCSREPGAPKNTLATAEETVKAYCDLDAQGARLTSATWSKVLPYISWAEEAGFDRAVVITGFTVGKARTAGVKGSTVEVVYQVLGTAAGEYTTGRRVETVRFTLARTDRGWKITEPDFLPPHVEVQAMVKHLEGTKQLEMAGKLKGEAK